jgi:Flp pilus assembly protein TadG
MFSRVTNKIKRRLLRRFIKNHDGTAAIEFAIVALPFFAILFAILETAIIFFAGQLLETGLSDAARLVRTGQAQNNEFDVADFKDAVCENVFALLECDTGLRIDVRELESFGGATLPPPVDENGDFDDSEFVYQPGNGGDIVLVRAFYEWPSLVPDVLGSSPSNLANGNYLLSATATFRNEPF